MSARELMEWRAFCELEREMQSGRKHRDHSEPASDEQITAAFSHIKTEPRGS